MLVRSRAKLFPLLCPERLQNKAGDALPRKPLCQALVSGDRGVAQMWPDSNESQVRDTHHGILGGWTEEGKELITPDLVELARGEKVTRI